MSHEYIPWTRADIDAWQPKHADPLDKVSRKASELMAACIDYKYATADNQKGLGDELFACYRDLLHAISEARAKR